MKLGSISEFLSKALQAPEALQVSNAINYLKIIGALDEKEDLTQLGTSSIFISAFIFEVPVCRDFVTPAKYTNILPGHLLSVLPVEPKLGKMLVFGAIFGCLDPIMTIVTSLCLREPFMNSSLNRDVSTVLVTNNSWLSQFF